MWMVLALKNASWLFLRPLAEVLTQKENNPSQTNLRLGLSSWVGCRARATDGLGADKSVGECLDLVRAEAGPVVIVCKNDWSLLVTKLLHFAERLFVDRNVDDVVFDAELVHVAVGCVALNAVGLRVNGDGHFGTSSIIERCDGCSLSKSRYTPREECFRYGDYNPHGR